MVVVSEAQLAAFLLLLAAALAMASSVVMLVRYRRSVVRLMAVRIPVPPEASAAAGDPTAAESGRVGPGVAPRLTTLLAHRHRVHVAIAVCAGLVVGLSYALLYVLVKDLAIYSLDFVVLTLVFSWPAAPAAWIASDGDRWVTAVIAAVLLVAPVLVAAAGTGLQDAVFRWVGFNGVTTLVVALFVTRAFRAVGVCLLGIWLAAMLGAFTLANALGEPDAADPGLRILDVGAVFGGVMLGGLLLGGVVGWLVFVTLARWYARRGFSDHMLLLGSLCLVFCLQYVAVVSPGHLGLLLIGVSLFSMLGVLAFAAFRLLVPLVPAPAALLVLRVFSDDWTTSRLLGAVSARWRHIGPVRLIGGADLALTNVEPDEFLAYTTGGLRRLFVASPTDLARRLAEPPPRPDPDGRYRVDEWFCLENAWRPTVEALLAGSDVVLMDLRGFTPQRQGTRYELEVLARTGALDRSLLLTDDSTDLGHLEWVLTGVSAIRPRTLRVEGADPRAVVRALTD